MKPYLTKIEISISRSEGYYDDDDDNEAMHQRNIKHQRALEGMKAELNAILATKSSQEATYHGKYPTSTGKLVIPKTLNQKKGKIITADS